jgi:hypothetical protein
MDWWLKPQCVSMKSWVKSLMDACLNVSCINVIYKHIHHGGHINIVHHAETMSKYFC